VLELARAADDVHRRDECTVAVEVALVVAVDHSAVLARDRAVTKQVAARGDAVGGDHIAWFEARQYGRNNR